MNTETSTAIALPDTFKPEVFKSLIDKAPDVYITSKTRVEKAIEVGTRLVNLAEQSIKENGNINEEIDTRLNNYLVNVRTASKDINDQRSPITSMFTAISKLYTSLENSLDTSKPETVAAKIQKIRNDYAAKKAKEAKEAAEVAQRKLNIEKEKISITTDSEVKLRQYFLEYLAEKQKELVNLFENTTIETYDSSKQLIEKFADHYSFTHFENFKAIFNPIYLTQQEVSNLITNAKFLKFDAFAKEFKETIQASKEAFIDKLPSKKAELETIAMASAEEAKRLKLDADKRIKEEAEKLQKEVDEKAAQATAQAETNKQVLTANTLFDLQVGTAAQATAQVREGYNIEITHPVGYQLIVAFYFEKEGLKETVEKLEKKTLGSMKTFCESWATKNDEKIQSPYIKYTETFKAVNKKV